ncbi:methyltransferase, FxLD system [Nonomuraea aridisoli]|uniref:Protein-L-isoaspartate O-methyltransferase n=1 Tax=Nonomuraea aridisoli TaxID=2070368 RepID=A0A2W2EZZ8_9ACTN|nr:methyltransferase, FxLD system [Nonomuraea aridisoli]PZG22529.1 methyltransferase, FxLD system [Nonomuraea aridisoli]
METNTAPKEDGTDRALRDAMVDELRSWGGVTTVQVEAAMRTVPRHVFVPDAPLEQAYGPDSVVTHRDENGTAISSASGVGVVSGMLEQLDVQPGHRVLEIGAGTGYNAALLAELAGPEGHVTTVDIGADIVAGARRGLAAAGYDRVQVIHGDGAAGHPENAPYDRIIVTAGAWEVPPTWREQLAPDGRLVVPLRIRGVTRSVALELSGDVWRSVSIDECGFMPMHGPEAVAELNQELPVNSGVWIRVDDGHPVDADAFAAALTGAPSLAWSGVVVPWQPLVHLDFWLVGATAQTCRVLVADRAREAGLVDPIYPWGSMGCYTSDSFAYLVRRPAPSDTAQEMVELGACAYGPDGERLAGEVADRVRSWGMARARDELAALRMEVHPEGSADHPAAMITADKARSRVFVICG